MHGIKKGLISTVSGKNTDTQTEREDSRRMTEAMAGCHKLRIASDIRRQSMLGPGRWLSGDDKILIESLAPT